jgi:hypothetical protein
VDRKTLRGVGKRDVWRTTGLLEDGKEGVLEVCVHESLETKRVPNATP